MGNKQAKTTETQKKTLTDVPWRRFSELHNIIEKSITEDIKSLERDVKPNILMLGPVGAGKSSLIAAILSIARKTRYGGALAGKATTSYTLKLKRHTNNTVFQGFNLYDCMGIEPDDGHGFPTEDIVFLLQGHMQNNYEFNPKSPMKITDSGYVAEPQVKDRMHCVVFVLNAASLHAISQDNIQKINHLQDCIRKEDVPRVIVLTMCDILCEEVRKNNANLFSSVKVQKAVKLASEIFSVEMASIHPVINHEEEPESRSDNNIYLLLAARQMASYAVDTVDNMLSDE